MLNKSHPDILIVGAGPAGLTLAVALATLDVNIRIVDRAPSTKHQPRAAIIWQRTLETLDLLGITRRLRPLANELCCLDIFSTGRRLGQIAVGGIASEFPRPFIIEQHVTEQVLEQRLNELGVFVEWSTEAVSMALREDHAQVTVVRDGQPEEVTAAWVVGCEGSDSLVRKAAAIEFVGRERHGLQAMQINATAKWRYPRDPARGMYFMDDGVSLGCFPLPEPDDAWRFFAYLRDTDPSDTSTPTPEQMRDLIARVARAPELEITLTEPRWIGRARFQDRVAATLRRGRALLAGDAAHVWAPIAGHGMNIGMRGACNLGWKLAAVVRGESPESLLDTYSDEQRRTALTVIRETRLDFVENLHSGAALSALSRLISIMLKWPVAQRWMNAMLSDILLHHRGSALSANASPTRGLRAGDRWPPRVPGYGTACPDYGEWRVYVLGIKDGEHLRILEQRYRGRIRIIASDLSALKDRIVVLRPDGYIGCLANGRDLNRAKKYLDNFLLRGNGE